MDRYLNVNNEVKLKTTVDCLNETHNHAPIILCACCNTWDLGKCNEGNQELQWYCVEENPKVFEPLRIDQYNKVSTMLRMLSYIEIHDGGDQCVMVQTPSGSLLHNTIEALGFLRYIFLNPTCYNKHTR